MNQFFIHRAGRYLLIFAAWFAFAAGAPAAEFFVSPAGSDANPGTEAKPFATLLRARQAVREAKAQNAGAKTEVFVRGGVYELAEPWQLGAGDSGSTWRAYHEEMPVLRGASAITNFVPHTGQVLKADVRALGFTNNFRQLFFNGRRQELARYPNVDPKNPLESGWTFTDKEPLAAESLQRVGAKRALHFSTADARKWARPTEGEVSIFPTHEWWNNLVSISAINPTERIIKLARNCNYEISPGDRYFVCGLLEELDAPGEWYLDHPQGVLYFWPAEPLAGKAVYAPRLRTMLELTSGARDVTLRGLTFEYCDGNAVTLTNTTNCLLVGCTIRNVGDFNGSGICLSGGSSNGVVGCDISDTGSHGINLGGGDEKTLTAAGNYAENNFITRTGAFYKQGNGVNLTGTGNRVARNTICELPRFGIQFVGQNHVVELNHIHHVCQETMDTAAIYGCSLNWLSGHGCVVRHNFVHDVIGRSGKAGKWLSPYYAWGIYLDWTAMGMTVSDNIVARTSRSGIMAHDGRDKVIENNIFVECGTGRHEIGATSQIEFSGWDINYGWWKREITNWCKQYDSVVNLPAWRNVPSLHDPRTAPLPDGRTMQRNVARRNILYWRDPQPQPLNFRNTSFEHNHSDSNLVWHFAQPLKTGQMKLKQATGPNLAPPNAGFEDGPVGQMPKGWSWHIQPSSKDSATVQAESAHTGRACLRLSGQADPANANKESWARIPSVKSAEVALQPGQIYRLTAWLRAERPNMSAELGLQAFRSGVYSWQSVQAFTLGTEWKQCEVIIRFPSQPAELKSAYVRIRLPSGNGNIYADDIELCAAESLDEWAAWQALGMDRHSIVADPMFVDAAKDDYRLKPESPAFKLGFQPIPTEKIGCYRDEARASWPLAGQGQLP